MGNLVKLIESRQNSEIKNIVALHERKHRRAQKRYIAQGLRVCSSLKQSGQTLQQLYATSGMLQEAQKLVSGHSITLVTDDVMEKISTTESPSGLLGIFLLPEPPKDKTLTSGVVLAQVTDPGNMGTLIRSCAAMGHKTVVIIEGTDAWSPKVVQASAGTIGMVNIITMSWPELVHAKRNTKLCALIVHGGKDPNRLDLRDTLLVVGNEASGIPAQWVADCDESLTLPMPGHAESLNAAIAGSIALYLSANIERNGS